MRLILSLVLGVALSGAAVALVDPPGGNQKDTTKTGQVVKKGSDKKFSSSKVDNKKSSAKVDNQKNTPKKDAPSK